MTTYTLYSVGLAAILVLNLGCSKSDAPSYLSDELSQPASISIAEERALRFAHQASTETMVLYSEKDIPTIYVRSAWIKLKDDHVQMVLALNVSYTHGIERWKASATPEIKNRAYSDICSKMVAHLAGQLEIPADLIEVKWQHFNAGDSGTYRDGVLDADYPQPSESKQKQEND